ncbi:MAG TPA: hypothetical protein VGK74_02705 [Symbiobacteriaceae bacterium]|jgi:hypothetical protein
MRFVTAEMGHVVNILPPVDITGGVLADRFTLGRHNHATITLSIGVSAATFTKIIVNACTLATAGVATAIPFHVYSCETTASDVLSARTLVAATGLTPSANDSIMYLIELDSAELPADSPWVELSLTNGANSVIACATVALSGSRYAGTQSATVLA